VLEARSSQKSFMNLDLCVHIHNHTDCIDTIPWQWMSRCMYWNIVPVLLYTVCVGRLSEAGCALRYPHYWWQCVSIYHPFICNCNVYCTILRLDMPPYSKFWSLWRKLYTCTLCRLLDDGVMSKLYYTSTRWWLVPCYSEDWHCQ